MPVEEDDQEKKRRLRTTDELRALASSVRDGTFQYDGRPKKSLDWSSYNEAQVNEIADTLNLMRKFVDIASARAPERHRNGRGRPPVPARDVAKALLLQAYFGVSDRVAAGLVRLFREKLGISREFSYKTIERGYDPSPVSELLGEVFRLTNQYGNAKETTFSVDGTGEPTSNKVNYESVRSEQKRKEEEKKDAGEGGTTTTSGKKNNSAASSPSSPTWPSSSSSSSSSKHDFQYTVASVGVHTLMYGGFRTIHDRSVSELSVFSSVMAETRINCPSMDKVLADSLYANRPACSTAAQSGARPYFLPKTNSTFRSHGVPSWMNMTYEFVDDPQEWLEEYHMRSKSETSNSMDKTKFPWKIRRMLPHRKDVASMLRRYVHNIRRYGYLAYLEPELIEPLRY